MGLRASRGVVAPDGGVGVPMAGMHGRAAAAAAAGASPGGGAWCQCLWWCRCCRRVTVED